MPWTTPLSRRVSSSDIFWVSESGSGSEVGVATVKFTIAFMLTFEGTRMFTQLDVSQRNILQAITQLHGAESMVTSIHYQRANLVQLDPGVMSGCTLAQPGPQCPRASDCPETPIDPHELRIESSLLLWAGLGCKIDCQISSPIAIEVRPRHLWEYGDNMSI